MTKVAVVTGGAGGMGLAVSKILGRDVTVVLSDVDSAGLDTAQRELADAGIESVTTVCDIGDRRSVHQLVEFAQKLGPVARVIHTAGVSPSMGSAEVILRINAVGTVLIKQAFLQVASPGMALVNVASVAGHQLPGFAAPVRRYKQAFHDTERLHSGLHSVCNLMPAARRPQMAYALSKNFVIWYSKAIAAQFGSKGARIVSVSPGTFDTNMGKLEYSAGGGALAQLGALKRLGHPSEIAELLAFCASEKAGYLTGTDIICDGGSMAAMTVSKLIGLSRS